MRIRIVKIFSLLKEHLCKYKKIYQIIFIPVIFSVIPIVFNQKVSIDLITFVYFRVFFLNNIYKRKLIVDMF